jgi:hypothetical protein
MRSAPKDARARSAKEDVGRIQIDIVETLDGACAHAAREILDSSARSLAA